MAGEHMKFVWCECGTEFLILFHFILTDLNNPMWLAASVLDGSRPRDTKE